MSLNEDLYPTAEFWPYLSHCGKVPGLWTIEEISQEPMLFMASRRFAFSHGGELTRQVLVQLEKQDAFRMVPTRFHPVIDTRVHMLMPGMYPTIPGWHCDGVPRRGPDGQPDLSLMDPEQKHWSVYMASGDGVSPTEFIFDNVSVRYHTRHVWGSVNQSVLRRQNSSEPLKVIRAAPGEIYGFNSKTLHRATPCTERGWRFFFRLSYMESEPANQIRRQTQVYMLGEDGW